jgi:putative addiction module component (TIGR02574 family)
MARAFEDLEEEVLSLKPEERVSLAERLFDSLDDLSEKEYDRLWGMEGVARYADFKAGRTAAIDGDEVLARARARHQ